MRAHRRFGIVLSLLVFTPLILAAGGPAGPSEMAGLTAVSNDTGTALSLHGGTAFYTTTKPVQNVRTVSVPDSPVVLMLWEEADSAGVTPCYAISLDGQTVARVTNTSYRLELAHRAFDPLGVVPEPEPGLAARPDNVLFIVQYIVQPLPEFTAQVEALGGVVRHFLPNHAQIVEMSAETRAAVAALPYVRWIGNYEPAYRLDESLRFLQGGGKDGETQRYNIQLTDWSKGQKEALAARIESIGGYVDSVDAGKRLIEATLTTEQLYEVVKWNEVFYVDLWGPYEADMNHVRVLGGANYIEAVAGFHGVDVRGEVFDAGFNLGHIDFQSRPLIQHGQTGISSHGASTSGIVFGDGTGDPTARGMLPAGQGIVGDYNYIGLSGPNRYTHTGEEPQAPYYCVFETSSVGNPQVLNYTTISADTDDALFDFDIVHLQSQSNMGSQYSRPQAWAKNIISVGATKHYDNEDWADDCWCSGASIGPAADGRIKPDICAVYDYIHCPTYPDNNYTNTFGGTSGATPICAGHTGLFFEMWDAGIFGNPVDPDGSVFDNRCHMTTAKAMMINTARQYAFTGTDVDLTRVHQGWGWPQVNHMYDMRDKFFIVDQDTRLTNLQSVTYTVYVEPNEPELKVTMTYPDPAGNPAAQYARINKLNLRVTDPNGNVYWGNNGLLEGNYSTPGGTANTVDTVENVFVQNPLLGWWSVQVIAAEIVQDGYPATPAMDAVFSLVVSGTTPCTATSDPPAPTNVDATNNLCDRIRVSWTAAPGATSYRVYRSTTNDPTTATLMATPAASPWDDWAVEINRVYYYWVVAVNCHGMSGFSTGDFGRRITVPAVPAGFEASDGYCDWIRVQWASVSINTVDYTIWRAEPLTRWHIVATVTAPPWYDRGATPGVTYSYRVTANNQCGSSGYSRVDTGYRGIPHAPTNVAATDGTIIDYVGVTWTADANPGAAFYQIYRLKVGEGGDPIRIGETRDQHYEDYDAERGVHYNYWVSAVNECGASALAGPDVGWRPRGLPPAPRDLLATDGKYPDKVVVKWVGDDDVAFYIVWRSTREDPYAADELGTTTEQTYDDYTGDPGVVYYYWAMAVNGYGHSDFSKPDKGWR